MWERVFTRALGKAIKSYAVGERLPVARALLEPKGLLTQPDIAEELARVISVDAPPNIQFIGERWTSRHSRASMIDSRSGRYCANGPRFCPWIAFMAPGLGICLGVGRLWGRAVILLMEIYYAAAG